MSLGREGAKVFKVDLLLGEAVGEEPYFSVEVGMEVGVPGWRRDIELVVVHSRGDFMDERFEMSYDFGFGLRSGPFELGLGY